MLLRSEARAYQGAGQQITTGEHLMTTCKAEQVWFAYHRRNWILKDINLQVPQEGFLIILGPSGSGKTTLVKVLAGLLKPQTGAVELLGHSLRNGLSARSEFRRQIGYIPQQLGLVRGMTALENVLVGALGRMRGPWPLLGIFPKQEVEQSREYLSILGIKHKVNEPVFRLSGGERQRVAIARTLLQKPKIVFADEFVSDLDLPRAVQVLEAMRTLCRCEGIAFVINLHEISLVQEVGDRVVVLNQGGLVHDGQAKDMSLAFLREMIQ